MLILQMRTEYCVYLQIDTFSDLITDDVKMRHVSVPFDQSNAFSISSLFNGPLGNTGKHYELQDRNGPEEKRTTEYIHKVIKKHLKPKSKRSKRAT